MDNIKKRGKLDPSSKHLHKGGSKKPGMNYQDWVKYNSGSEAKHDSKSMFNIPKEWRGEIFNKF